MKILFYFILQSSLFLSSYMGKTCTTLYFSKFTKNLLSAWLWAPLL